MNPVPKPKQQPKPLPGFIPKVNAKRAAIRRARDFGSEAEWIVTLPCCVSGWKSGQVIRTGTDAQEAVVDAAHVRSRGAGGRKRGNLIPLERAYHERQHRDGWEAIGLTLEKAHEMALEYQRLFDERFAERAS